MSEFIDSAGTQEIIAGRPESRAQGESDYEFLQGGGEMGRIMRAKDWSATPLGDPGDWPQSLRTSVSTCLNCSFPILLWWGPDLIKIYNNAYASIIAGKHPSALGAKGRDVWPEIWRIIEPMLASAMAGEATPADDLLLMLERNGYPEECYFSFSYSPIRDESGGVGGVFCPVIETTDKVVSQRRLDQLRRLADETADLHSVREVLAASAASLANATADFPFAALFGARDGERSPVLMAATGISESELAGLDAAFAGALKGPVIVALQSPPETIRSAGAGSRSRAVILSLSPGFIVLGLTPHRPIEEMQGAAQAIAGQISSRISRALAAEADRARLAAIADREQATSRMLAAVNEALVDSEARLRRHLQQMPGFSAILSGPDHVFQYVNDAYVKISGEREFIGRSVREVFPEVEGQGFFELLDQVYISGEPFMGSAIPVLLAGEDEHRFIDLLYEPTRDDHGAVGGIFVGGYDVTTQVQTQAALQTQRAQLQAVIDTVPAAVWFTHDSEARNVVGNAYAAKLLRLAGDQNHSLTPGQGDRPVDFAAFREGTEVVAIDLPMQRAARGEIVPTEELELRFSNGDLVWIEIQASPIRADNGDLEGAVCTALDITARKIAESALRKSEEEFRILAENQPNLCWMADHTGWIYWYNRGWYEYTGTSQEDMEGWGWQSVHDPSQLAGVMERWTSAIATGELFDMTFPLRGADGQFRPFLTRVAPIRDSAGVITRWVGNNVDVSEQLSTEAALRASEQALRDLNSQLEVRVAEEVQEKERTQTRLVQAQRMEALGQLAGGIAHDFNNVLQAVAGGLSLIQRRAAEPEEVRKLAQMAISASDRGAAITGRLLSFARRGELQPSAIAPRRLLESLREILAPTLGAGIQIILEVADDAPRLVADKAQLETVLINLAVNARDAMTGGGELTIRAVAQTVGAAEATSVGVRPGSYVRLELCDNGAGMDSATLQRASEPFFTTKPSGQGTGLGLSMARGFAEQSEGAFSISSEPGLGTTVTLWFPESVETAATMQPGDAPRPSTDFRGHALVVDDDPIVREILSEQLQAVGFQTTAATDGLDALSQLDGGLIVDVLVTDYSMPGMNGMVLIEEARRRRPDLPVLLLTGFADDVMRAKLEKYEAQSAITGLLRKPADEDQLAQRLAAVLAASPRHGST